MVFAKYLPGLKHVKYSFDSFDLRHFLRELDNSGPRVLRNHAPNLCPLERFALRKIGHVSSHDLQMLTIYLKLYIKKKMGKIIFNLNFELNSNVYKRLA